MLQRETVIVVGAGASAEFGLPTGEAIYQAASEDNETSANHHSVTYADRFLSTFSNFLAFENQGGLKQEFIRLGEHLKSSPSQSIDLYAYQNPSKSAIAKLFTAWTLTQSFFTRHQRRDQFGDVFESIERAYPWRNPIVGVAPNRRANWLGVLTNLYLARAKSIDDLPPNKLTFVTFNYDPVIEESFSYFLRRSERFRDLPDDLVPRVIHVHGKMEDIVEGNLQYRWFDQQKGRIKFISDTLENPSDQVIQARQALNEAMDVFCVGFAFEDMNMELLEAEKWGGKAVALNFDGHPGVQNRMRRIGISDSNVRSGSPGQQLFLGTAASQGFFEMSANQK